MNMICKMCGRPFALARWDTTRPHRSGMNSAICRDCYNLPENPPDNPNPPVAESSPSGTAAGVSLTTEDK